MKATNLSQFHGFHGYYDANLNRIAELLRKHTAIRERELSYQFYPHFHPYIAELVQRLITKSVSGLQAADTEYLQNEDGSLQTFPNTHPNEALRSQPIPKLYREIFSSGPSRYNPSSSYHKPSYKASSLVQQPYPVKDLDFTSSGAYAVYNWELFFHVPITIAIHLSKNQRFEEAQHWFHYIFDPTDDSDGPTPERFWKVKPFQYNDVQLIEDILVNLSSNADPQLRQETVNSINALKDAPFRPHVVARYRQSAYMFKTVMAYLDNLIDWGDSLFRQDTGESINEATMLYVLAANILGPRPQAVPKKGSVRPQTYANLRADLDEFGNVLLEVENNIPFDLTPHPTDATDRGGDRAVTIESIGNALYFCIPRNDKLLGYWDTVADRLFKIRNSLNIQGIFRQLPLFEPPIDPALLAKAAAAGLDVGAVISGINQPLPLVRFQVLIQRASEICQEVKSLGNNLLSAMEKEDNEAIALLRAKHERLILGRVETVRYAQWQEAIKTREGLEQSLTNAVERYIYYERQLGKKESEIEIPQLDELDKEGLLKMSFDMQEPKIKTREITIDIAKGSTGTIGSATFGILGSEDITGGKNLNSHEAEELNRLELAHELPKIAKGLKSTAESLSHIPDFPINLHFWGMGGTITMGGSLLSGAANFAAEALEADASNQSYGANRASKLGVYTQRERDWAFQSNVIAGEITQIFKQLRAAQIREAIAEREWKNHQQQIKNAEEIEQFLKGEETPVGNQKHKKISTQSFYTWMKREVQGLYRQCFQFAFDIAKKAERALQHELGKPEQSFLQFNYLSGKEGLLAGEKLYLDIKRMEMAYHDLNQREYELTKHISLLQVNPLALLQLRATGQCTVTLPEELFDLDGPGHYFRRIKNVAVSIPCVAGSYTSVNCTLTLTKSTIRKSALLIDDRYARVDAEDTRFSDRFGSLQSIVTSTGQNDSGLFETNLRDERYLPFENSGAISEWQLKLPGNPSKKENDPNGPDPLQFDYDTISDVIIHLRYTAREGGKFLKDGAIAHLKQQIDAAQTAGSVRLFSLRHEFPTEWAKFKSIKIGGETKTAELTLNLQAKHYPFWSQSRLEAVEQIDFFAKNAQDTVEISAKADGTGDTDLLNKPLGDLEHGTLENIKSLDKPIGELTLYFSNNLMEDLWLAVKWGKN